MRTGTKEWSELSYNIQLGCENGCRYCWARQLMVERYKKCTAGQWLNPVINPKKVNCTFKKQEGVIMFPTIHDITLSNYKFYAKTLEGILEAGNEVLIVSKPNWHCITSLCENETVKRNRERLMFRFTIGSINDEVLRFWEPNAPGFNERLSCLRYAKMRGYQTSVSCEPFLDGEILRLYETCIDFVTDSFWIGLLRDFDDRVDLTGVTEGQKIRFVELLKKFQEDWFVKWLYRLMDGRPLVRWKDSINTSFETRLSKK